MAAMCVVILTSLGGILLMLPVILAQIAGPVVNAVGSETTPIAIMSALVVSLVGTFIWAALKNTSADRRALMEVIASFKDAVTRIESAISTSERNILTAIQTQATEHVRMRDQLHATNNKLIEILERNAVVMDRNTEATQSLTREMTRSKT